MQVTIVEVAQAVSMLSGETLNYLTIQLPTGDFIRTRIEVADVETVLGILTASTQEEHAAQEPWEQKPEPPIEESSGYRRMELPEPILQPQTPHPELQPTTPQAVQDTPQAQTIAEMAAALRLLQQQISSGNAPSIHRSVPRRTVDKDDLGYPVVPQRVAPQSTTASDVDEDGISQL